MEPSPEIYTVPPVVLLALPAAACVIVGALLLVTAIRSRSRAKQIVGALLLVAASLLIWRIVASQFWAVNNCLDVGGVYDADLEECVYGADL